MDFHHNVPVQVGEPVPLVAEVPVFAVIQWVGQVLLQKAYHLAHSPGRAWRSHSVVWLEAGSCHLHHTALEHHNYRNLHMYQDPRGPGSLVVILVGLVLSDA